MNTFTVDNEDNYPSCYKVNDAKTFENLVVSFETLRLQNIYILVHLTESFKCHVHLVLCIIGPDKKGIKLNVLDPFLLKRANKLSKLNQSIYSQDRPGR